MTRNRQPRPWRGLAAGLAGGLIASAAMAVAQRVLAGLQPDSDEDPATVKAADRVSGAVAGAPVPGSQREAAGNAVHYLTGAALGAGYGVLAEYAEAPTAGFGAGFGAAVSAVLDEAIVPAVGLGAPPWRTPARTHLFGLLNHIVFGIVLEASRRALVGAGRD